MLLCAVPGAVLRFVGASRRLAVTSGLQIQSGAGPRPSADAASVAGSQIEESVWSASAVHGQRDLTQI